MNKLKCFNNTNNNLAGLELNYNGKNFKSDAVNFTQLCSDIDSAQIDWSEELTELNVRLRYRIVRVDKNIDCSIRSAMETLETLNFSKPVSLDYALGALFRYIDIDDLE